MQHSFKAIFNASRCQLLIVLLGVVGFFAALFLAKFGFSLTLASWLDWLLVVIIMPFVETLVFNYWFQQGLFEWLKHKKISLRLAYWLAGSMTAVLFVLAHVGVIGSMAWLWIFPSAVLACIWFYCPSILTLSIVHTTWNFCLWLVS